MQDLNLFRSNYWIAPEARLRWTLIMLSCINDGKRENCAGWCGCQSGNFLSTSFLYNRPRHIHISMSLFTIWTLVSSLSEALQPGVAFNTNLAQTFVLTDDAPVLEATENSDHMLRLWNVLVHDSNRHINVVQMARFFWQNAFVSLMQLYSPHALHYNVHTIKS